MSRSIHNYDPHVTGDNGRFESGIQMLRHFHEKSTVWRICFAMRDDKIVGRMWRKEYPRFFLKLTSMHCLIKKRDKGLREVTLKNDSIKRNGVDRVEKYNVNIQIFKHALVNLCITLEYVGCRTCNS